MKIGQAAKKFAVPVTSIYYYIKHGLLVPPVSRGQYVFDEKTLSDLEWLLTLKQMEFPLEVIHRILSLRRISGLMPQEDRDELRKMFAEQDRALEEKIETLTHAQQLLRSSVSLLGAGDCEIVDTGVPLKMLRLLACPVCGGELRAQNASMDSRYIFEAEMNCRCGYSARIQNGILLTQNRNTSFYDKPDTIRELYRDLPSATLSLFERSYHWLGECLTKAGTSGKVMWESYVNAWFFLHNHTELLLDGTELIVTDKFPETLLAYKEVIDRCGRGLDILYIADAGTAPPIKKKCVDITVDFFATNEHNFYHDDFWPNYMSAYLKDGGLAAGVYFYFDGGERSMKNLLRSYPEASRNNFSSRFFRKELRSNYKLLSQFDCGFSTDSGANLGLGFHEKGDKLHLLAYEAVKEKRNLSIS